MSRLNSRHYCGLITDVVVQALLEGGFEYSLQFLPAYAYAFGW